MSAENRHVLEISGETLREISEKAVLIFDKFFAREIDWEVARFETRADIVTLRDGTGAVIAEREVTWHATIEAVARGVFIGVQRQERAVWFPVR